MKTYQTILIHTEGGLATITLNRPEVRNAINIEMIREISAFLEELDGNRDIRVIHIRSSLDYFCAGADLNWMRAGLEQTETRLLEESRELAGLYRRIRESRAISICGAKSRIPGGAIGLLAACDLVVAEEGTTLQFTELKLGLLPATIAPHVLRKVGIGRTIDWMATGRTITAEEAREAGLVQRICRKGSLDEETGNLSRELMAKDPEALRELKKMLIHLEGEPGPEETDSYTSRLIARMRISPGGQQGMKEFLENKKTAAGDGKN